MIRFVVILVAVMFLVSVVVALLLSVLVLLALACAVGIPLYLLGREWMNHQGVRRPAQSPIERLRALYLEDKIDLFEFEKRVAQHIRAGH